MTGRRPVDALTSATCWPNGPAARRSSTAGPHMDAGTAPRICRRAG